MKVGGYSFWALALFYLASAVVYWFMSHDPTGTTCLVLSFALAAMVGYYLLFTARRMEPQPEDHPDAEIADGAGELGFFSPYSYWPVATAAAASVIALGMVFGPFLIVIGLAFLVFTVIGFLFEYYVGHRPFAD